MSPKILAKCLAVPIGRAEAWCQPLVDAMAAYQISTPARQAAFLAQVGHESAGLSRVVESLTYRASRIVAVWPRRFPTIAAAQPYANNPAKLADKVYGGRLGNTMAGDGYRFRGRGLLQVTGRANYAATGEALGLDLIGFPELLEVPHFASRSAAWWWKANGLNGLADLGNFEKITRVINGGLNGYEDRLRLWKACQGVLT